MSNQYFGINILSESEQSGQGSAFSVAFTIENPKEVKKSEKLLQKFDRLYKELFVNLVGEIHKYLIRITPIHTGKLRGGWTAFLNKHQIDYIKQLYDTTLYDAYKKANISLEHRDYKVDSASVEAGKGMSSLEDKLPGDTDVAVDNKVPYKDYMDFGTSTIPGRHFTDLARYKGELWFQIYFNEWFKRMEKAGAIVEPPKVSEIGV